MNDRTSLYLVTVDGWTEGYGSEIYVVGIFDDLKKAEGVVKENVIKFGSVTNEPRIVRLDLNDICRLRRDKFGNFSNHLYLGGYVE